jgi:hypothetical protein
MAFWRWCSAVDQPSVQIDHDCLLQPTRFDVARQRVEVIGRQRRHFGMVLQGQICLPVETFYYRLSNK